MYVQDIAKSKNVILYDPSCGGRNDICVYVCDTFDTHVFEYSASRRRTYMPPPYLVVLSLVESLAPPPVTSDTVEYARLYRGTKFNADICCNNVWETVVQYSLVRMTYPLFVTVLYGVLLR
jgi:hypothetical protein